MINQSLALIGLTLTLSANAATLVVSGGQLMGAAGVGVGGINYDVSFVNGTCHSLFNGCTGFAFHTSDEALEASQALLDQVLIGIFDEHPAMTNGVDIPAPEAALLTPYHIQSNGRLPGVAVAWNVSGDGEDYIADAGGFGGLNHIETASTSAYAVWTPTAVPLPAAAWLFMSAIAGLAGGKRISRSKRSV